MGEPARPGHALDHEAPSAGSSIAADATRATYRCDRRDDCAQMNLRIGDSRGHGGFICDRRPNDSSTDEADREAS